MLRRGLWYRRLSKAKRLLVVSLMHEIQSAVDNDSDCTCQIEKLNEITSGDFDRDYFESLHSHSSLDEAIDSACISRPKLVSDLSRDELADIVRRSIAATENDEFAKMEYYCELFDRNVAMPKASNVIYFFEKYWPDDEHPSVEKILTHVLDYKVICL
jgi:hypothetical protein